MTQENQKWGCSQYLLLIAGIGIFSIFLMSAFSGGGSNSSYTPPEHNEGMAYQIAQTFVERQLKSPSTAEFPRSSSSDVTIKKDYRTYEISSHVDSQNSFGAQVRSDFDITVRFDGDGNWSQIALEID